MRPGETRSHRLNYLLRSYQNNPNEFELYYKAKSLGVNEITARDYVRTVMIQANKMNRTDQQ